jgi:DNA-binding transcriptional LysR family regulator
MDLKQLYYFKTIVEEGTINAAAKKLYMSQPPLSTQIHMLEKELDCTLFERGRKQIQMTDEGKILYERAVMLLNACDVAKEEVMACGNPNRGIIRIGIVSSVVSSLTPVIGTFSSQYPDIRFEITEANTYQLIEKLNSSLLHFAIIRTPFSADGFSSQVLLNDTLAAFGDYKLLPDESGNLSLNQLSCCPIILYRRWEAIIRDKFETSSLPLNCKCVCDDARTALGLVENGAGIGLLPKSVMNLVSKEDVFCRDISDCSIESEIIMLYSTKSYIPQCTKLFMSRLKDSYAVKKP